MDNLNFNHKSIDNGIGFIVEFARLYRKLGLGNSSLSELCCIYHSWKKDSSGLTSWEIYRYMDYSNYGRYHCVCKRMIDLQKKGLIEVVGTGRNSCMVYAPTLYACSVLESFFGSGSTEEEE